MRLRLAAGACARLAGVMVFRSALLCSLSGVVCASLSLLVWCAVVVALVAAAVAGLCQEGSRLPFLICLPTCRVSPRVAFALGRAKVASVATARPLSQQGLVPSLPPSPSSAAVAGLRVVTRTSLPPQPAVAGCVAPCMCSSAPASLRFVCRKGCHTRTHAHAHSFSCIAVSYPRRVAAGVCRCPRCVPSTHAVADLYVATRTSFASSTSSSRTASMSLRRCSCQHQPHCLCLPLAK